MKAKIGCYLAQSKKVSLAADIWSKKGLTSSYLGITGHFFSFKDHRRHSVTLAVRRMPPNHTASNVRAIVGEALSEWEIPMNKISAILTDNGSNMVAAFRGHFHTSSEDEDESDGGDVDPQGKNCEEEDSVERDVSDFEEQEIEHEVAFHDFRRVSCFSHSLQLVVHHFDTVMAFKEVLKRTHALVRKVNSSTKATEMLISLCGKKLIRDCPTRWSSTFLLIERLLEVKTSLISVLAELEWDSLATSEWKVLEGINTLLQPFAQFTQLISGENFTTLSSVYPAIVEIKMHLEEVLDSYLHAWHGLHV